MGDQSNYIINSTDRIKGADKEIGEFERWFQSELKQAALIRSERAVLRMYVLWKKYGPKWVAEVRGQD